jgi:hypothetical protein
MHTRGAIVLLAIVLLVFAWGVEVAYPIPCVAGTAASVANTSCSIGDKQFSFGAVVIDDRGFDEPLSAEAILFTPNAADPFAPGFTLSGPLTAEDFEDVSLTFSGVRITTLDGLATILGLSASVTGTTFIIPPFPGIPIPPGTAFIAAEFRSGAGSAFALPLADPGSCGGTCQVTDTDTAFFFSPVADTGAGGRVRMSAFADFADATNVASSFFVLQVRSVPEPTTLFLLGTSAIALGLAGWRRRKNRPGSRA